MNKECWPRYFIFCLQSAVLSVFDYNCHFSGTSNISTFDKPDSNQNWRPKVSTLHYLLRNTRIFESLDLPYLVNEFVILEPIFETSGEVWSLNNGRLGALVQSLFNLTNPQPKYKLSQTKLWIGVLNYLNLSPSFEIGRCLKGSKLRWVSFKRVSFR